MLLNKKNIFLFYIFRHKSNHTQYKETKNHNEKNLPHFLTATCTGSHTVESPIVDDAS
jgi:hypothetical protein